VNGHPSPSRQTPPARIPGRSPPRSGSVHMPQQATRRLAAGWNAPLHEEQTRHAATNSPRRLRHHKGEQSSPSRRVVTVRTELLAQVRAGGKWRRAQRASALISVLPAVIGLKITGRSGRSQGRATVTGNESAKTIVTGCAQSRNHPYRTSLTDSGGRKVAGRAPCEPIVNNGPKRQADGLDHFGSNRIANIAICGGHVTIASSKSQDRLRGREGRHSSSSS
jgi:hypothetical protein